MYKYLLIGLLFFIPTAFASADYTITTSTHKDDIVGWGCLSSCGGNIISNMAQPFVTVGAGTLTSSVIGVIRNTTVTDNIVVSIYADGSSEPTGSALATETLSGSSLTTDCSTGDTTVTFSSPPSLSAATKYWIVIGRSDSGSTGYDYDQCGLDGSDYASGTMIRKHNGTWDQPWTRTWRTIESITEGGGGGGGSATSTVASTTIIMNPNQDAANGIFLFFIGFFGIIWLFKKR